MVQDKYLINIKNDKGSNFLHIILGVGLNKNNSAHLIKNTLVCKTGEAHYRVQVFVFVNFLFSH